MLYALGTNAESWKPPKLKDTVLVIGGLVKITTAGSTVFRLSGGFSLFSLEPESAEKEKGPANWISLQHETALC